MQQGQAQAGTVHIVMGFHLHITVDVQIEIVESVFLGAAQTTEITGKNEAPRCHRHHQAGFEHGCDEAFAQGQEMKFVFEAHSSSVMQLWQVGQK